MRETRDKISKEIAIMSFEDVNSRDLTDNLNQIRQSQKLLFGNGSDGNGLSHFTINVLN